MINASRLTVIPIVCERKDRKFDLNAIIAESITNQKVSLKDKDIVIVSSKYAAMAEGRYVKLSNLKVSKKGRALSEAFKIDPYLSEQIVREADSILGGIPGYALAYSKGVLAPNAGIDRSNIRKGYAILYPKDPKLTAKRLSDYLGNKSGKRIGVILSDSRVTPGRLGTIGIAVAAAGFEPLLDFRGKTDLFGNVLKVTIRAVADQMASAGQLVMGEAAESTPVAIIRGWKGNFEPNNSVSMEIEPEKCIYIQGLSHPFEGIMQ
jgi:coenzyme F420-0:L-glutamate ligase / coenzyme F420-1:gamma-L-glutamate ligase